MDMTHEYVQCTYSCVISIWPPPSTRVVVRCMRQQLYQQFVRNLNFIVNRNWFRGDGPWHCNEWMNLFAGWSTWARRFTVGRKLLPCGKCSSTKGSSFRVIISSNPIQIIQVITKIWWLLWAIIFYLKTGQF